MESWKGRDIYSDYGCQKGLFQLRVALLPTDHLETWEALSATSRGTWKSTDALHRGSGKASVQWQLAFSTRRVPRHEPPLVQFSNTEQRLLADSAEGKVCVWAPGEQFAVQLHEGTSSNFTGVLLSLIKPSADKWSGHNSPAMVLLLSHCCSGGSITEEMTNHLGTWEEDVSRGKGSGLIVRTSNWSNPWCRDQV